jgi:hypothetical protein
MATNYGKLVQQLRSERAVLQQQVNKLTQAIDALDGSGTRRRGGRGRTVGGTRQVAGAMRRRRRPMSAAARRAVSLRMKKYWAARRKAESA